MFLLLVDSPSAVKCYIYLQIETICKTFKTMQDTTKTITPPIMDIDDRNAWKAGFTPQAEIWNGRLAMLGFAAALLIELTSGQGLLHFWGLL